MSEGSDGAGAPLEALDHVEVNRAHWNAHAHEWVASGERAWAQEEPTWGMWSVPERELEMLPDDLADHDAIELGCGTGYVSAWLARRGARVTGIDVSPVQLDTARRLAEQHGADVRLVLGNAEATPFEDASFDFAVSEYGAAIWCDPFRWIPEAHRLLRPGGRLSFLGHHPLAQACCPLDGSQPPSEHLARPYFDQHRLDWTEVPIDPGGIEFNMPISGWVALFRSVGFVVEDYREPRPPDGVREPRFSATPEWARRYPSEQVWKLRKA